MKKHWLVNGSCAGKAQKHKRNDLSEIHRRNLYNLTLGTLREALQSNWEPLLGNFGNLGNLHLGTMGTFTWEPLLGNLYLGTFTWEPSLGNLHLGTFTWEPLLGNLHLRNLDLGTFTWEPLLGNLHLGTFT